MGGQAGALGLVVAQTDGQVGGVIVAVLGLEGFVLEDRVEGGVWCYRSLLDEDVVAHITLYGDKSIRSVRYKTNNKTQDHNNTPAYRTWFPNGNIESTQHYTNNTRNNPNPHTPAVQIWYRHGKLKTVRWYQNGKLDDPNLDVPASQDFFSNGQTWKQKHYLDGKLHNPQPDWHAIRTWEEEGGTTMPGTRGEVLAAVREWNQRGKLRRKEWWTRGTYSHTQHF